MITERPRFIDITNFKAAGVVLEGYNWHKKGNFSKMHLN